MDDIELIKKALDDTLYVFSAVDGGVAYAKLIHGIMPTVYGRIGESDKQFVDMFIKWGKLMKLAKGEYDESRTSTG